MGAHELSRRAGALIAGVLLVATAAWADVPPASSAPRAPARDAVCVADDEAQDESQEQQGPPASGGAPSDVPDEVPLAKKEKNYSIVPIPEIILDPNEGNTYGLMGVVLFKNERDEIQYLVAPDFRWNETKGAFPTFRLYGYPTPERRYTVSLGKSTTRDEDYEIEYADGVNQKTGFFLAAKLLYERDSTERFYGVGNHSPESGESNYTSQDLYADANPGYWVLPNVNVSYRMRIRRFNTQPGQVAAVPDLGDPKSQGGHPFVPGRQPSVYWQHRLALTYDTRDSVDQPTEGMYGNAYVDGADRHVGSATSFVAFGFEWRDFVPLFGERRNPVLAMRAFVDYLQGGNDTPFWLKSSLGGRRALRGFGSDRFVDFNRSLVSAELRTRVYQHRIFGVVGELELAPFVELGQVFRHIDDKPLDDPHYVGGLGFRAVVRPQIVAFVDVGYGEEGQAVFTGIDYPF